MSTRSAIAWLNASFRLGLLLFLTILSAHAQSSGLGRVGPDVWRVGTIQQQGLTEPSGLVASRQYPGVFWTHNDTTDPNFLFAINQKGEHLGAFEVKGARLIDWEASAMDEHGNIYLADIGTNGIARTYSAVHRIAEPNPGDRSGPAWVEKTWFIRYPGSREEAESFFVLNGFGYVMTKWRQNDAVDLYRFALGHPDEFITLELVTSVPVPNDVGDATLSPDASRLVLVTDEGVAVDFITGNPALAGKVPRRFVRYESSLMEGGAFTTNGILVVSESPEILLFTGSELAGAPIITVGLSNVATFPGRSAEFSIEVDTPLEPTYEWRFNQTVIPGQTAPTLLLTNISQANAGTYEVIVSNAAGVARSSAPLIVNEPRFEVRITEVMSSEVTPNIPTADWWELTNFGTDPVNVSGWRFNDSRGALDNAYVITNDVTIQPGESVIFIEDLTPEQFLAWWGQENIPTGTQIISYTSEFALSFSEQGDSVRLWDATTTDINVLIDRADFGTADPGVSFSLDPVTRQFGRKSQVGVDGAFRAAAGTEVGSPGRVTGLMLQGRNAGGLLELTIAGAPETRYVLESSDDLAHWTAEQTGEGGSVIRKPSTSSRRFYRLRRE